MSRTKISCSVKSLIETTLRHFPLFQCAECAVWWDCAQLSTLLRCDHTNTQHSTSVTPPPAHANQYSTKHRHFRVTSYTPYPIPAVRARQVAYGALHASPVHRDCWTVVVSTSAHSDRDQPF